MNIQPDKLIYGLESLTKKAPNFNRKKKEAGVNKATRGKCSRSTL